MITILKTDATPAAANLAAAPRPAARPVPAAAAGAAFEVGRTYWTRSICDWECIHRITITRRTAKTIRTACGKTLRISSWQGVEQVKPFGSYSMCAVIGADRAE